MCVFSLIFFFLFGFSSLAHHIHTYTVHYASIVYTKEQYAGRTASPKTQSRCECSKYMICPSSPLIFLRSPVLFFVRQTGSPSFYFWLCYYFSFSFSFFPPTLSFPLTAACLLSLSLSLLKSPVHIISTLFLSFSPLPSQLHSLNPCSLLWLVPYSSFSFSLFFASL